MTTQNRRPRPDPERPKRIRKGLVIINTGDGKGKSTAAFGVMTRAWGRDMKVSVIQFIKQPKGQYGEQLAAEKMGIEMTATGKGFTWESEDLADDAVVVWPLDDQQAKPVVENVLKDGQVISLRVYRQTKEDNWQNRQGFLSSHAFPDRPRRDCGTVFLAS